MKVRDSSIVNYLTSQSVSVVWNKYSIIGKWQHLPPSPLGHWGEIFVNWLGDMAGIGVNMWVRWGDQKDGTKIDFQQRLASLCRYVCLGLHVHTARAPNLRHPEQSKKNLLSFHSWAGHGLKYPNPLTSNNTTVKSNEFSLTTVLLETCAGSVNR